MDRGFKNIIVFYTTTWILTRSSDPEMNLHSVVTVIVDVGGQLCLQVNSTREWVK